jgi:hypothetical protein
LIKKGNKLFVSFVYKTDNDDYVDVDNIASEESAFVKNFDDRF